MEKQPQTIKFNPNPKPNGGPAAKKSAKKEKDEFEFCKVCKLNHNLGRRHNYLPNHIKALSSFLAKFQSKLSDVRFFLRNPSLLRPEHASRNRLWCVFCDQDIDEVGNSFACGNAINHLASADHLRSLKGFMWKYGGGMDRVDSFRVSEEDVAKYENKCTVLKSEVAGVRSRMSSIGPSNDIHNEVNFECTNSFDNNTIKSCNSGFSNGVLPLQNYTKENQVCDSEYSTVTSVGTCLLDARSYLCASTQLDTSEMLLNNTGYVNSQLSSNFNGRKSSPHRCLSNGVVHQVCHDGTTTKGESSSIGLAKLTQISSAIREGDPGNVHSGAPPPWLDTTRGDLLDVTLKPSANKAGKSSKLNPKRVGAAWAEKRKMEIEMEKRGVPVNSYDSNWLPNFGSVWQSGSRKESQKEFEVDGKRHFNERSQPEMPTQNQPYISKRMRQDTTRFRELQMASPRF